jgi:hypothetical protein
MKSFYQTHTFLSTKEGAMKQNLLMYFFLLLFLFSGCQKPIENTENTIPAFDREYQIEMKAGNFEGSAKIFFDEEGIFHLIHSDPSSPLCGMEEIYSDGKIKIHFGNLLREENTRFEGTALAFFAIDLISQKSPEKRENGVLEEQEVQIYTFSETEKSAKLFLLKADHSPIKIIGEGSLAGLEIQFLNLEQN